MKEKSKERTLIEELFHAVIRAEESKTGGRSFSDLFMQIDTKTGELQIYNDADHLCGSTTIYKWIEDRQEEPTEEMKEALRAVISDLYTRGFFDLPEFVRPFSVQLVEEDFSLIEEMLFLDDEIVRLDDPLLQGLDEDLDKFLADLLAE